MNQIPQRTEVLRGEKALAGIRRFVLRAAAVLAIYIALAGPAFWLADYEEGFEGTVYIVYLPLILARDVPVVGPVIRSYVAIWTPAGCA